MNRFLPATALLAALASGAAQAATWVPLNPQATYLRTSENTTTPGATALTLSDHGFAPGDRLLLEVVGAIDNGPGSDSFSFTMGLFSSSSLLLPQTELTRVPGALASDGLAFVSSATFFGNLPTDIAQDFGFDAPAPQVVTVPAGATVLFLAKHDQLYQDNSDPNGDYGVRISLAPVPEPGAAALWLAGLAAVGGMARRRRR